MQASKHDVALPPHASASPDETQRLRLHLLATQAALVVHSQAQASQPWGQDSAHSGDAFVQPQLSLGATIPQKRARSCSDEGGTAALPPRVQTPGASSSAATSEAALALQACQFVACVHTADLESSNAAALEQHKVQLQEQDNVQLQEQLQAAQERYEAASQRIAHLELALTQTNLSVKAQMEQVLQACGELKIVEVREAACATACCKLLRDRA